MKQISLTRGQFALVDDENYEWLNKWKWYTFKGPYNKTFYAVRNYAIGKKRFGFRMHRLILALEKGDGKQCDHIDGNGLNNQKSNLRICTQGQNNRNVRLRKDSTSGAKGVNWHKGKKRWIARVQTDGKRIEMSSRDKNAAIRKYNMMAKMYHGEFAVLNKEIF